MSNLLAMSSYCKSFFALSKALPNPKLLPSRVGGGQQIAGQESREVEGRRGGNRSFQLSGSANSTNISGNVVSSSL